MGADYVELDTSMRFDHALVKYLSGRKARFYPSLHRSTICNRHSSIRQDITVAAG